LITEALPRTFEYENLVRAIPDKRVTDLMLELLALKTTDKLLEIGTGSATQTAIWQEHCAEVHTIELNPVPCADYLGDAAYFHSGDGVRGLPGESPFDAIVVTCGTEVIAEAWKEQLADGGRLVVPYGSPEVQKLTLFMKKNGVFGACKIGGYVRFQMMREA
jgi:protein-L-isoaspartate(D-aspartate) O-methyltransferase